MDILKKCFEFSAMNAGLRKQSILIIDDSKDALVYEKILLELENFEVFTARSGAEAFEILSRIKKPNLILLDMIMPDMTGSEFMSLLENKRPDIIENVPIVFHTGMQTIPLSKAIGFIRKPVDIDKFVQSVHHFIETGFSTLVTGVPSKCL